MRRASRAQIASTRQTLPPGRGEWRRPTPGRRMGVGRLSHAGRKGARIGMGGDRGRARSCCPRELAVKRVSGGGKSLMSLFSSAEPAKMLSLAVFCYGGLVAAPLETNAFEGASAVAMPAAVPCILLRCRDAQIMPTIISRIPVYMVNPLIFCRVQDGARHDHIDPPGCGSLPPTGNRIAGTAYSRRPFPGQKFYILNGNQHNAPAAQRRKCVISALTK